jgi:hypothetical protein
VVGCYTQTSDKIGKDVGTLCGMKPIGVAATDDIQALLALKTDCVVYMPEAVGMMADALKLKLDDIRYSVEFAAATEDVDLGYMTIGEGCISGLRGCWAGFRGGSPHRDRRRPGVRRLSIGIVSRAASNEPRPYPVRRNISNTAANPTNRAA